MIRKYLTTLLSFSVLFTIGQNYEPTSTTGKVIHHHYYSLSYSEQHEQPEWVYYILTPLEVNGPFKRTDDFREDPKVETGSASLNDYVGSGYDRGHLCAAADMKRNNTAMSETFYLSNMSPQAPYFNRGIWKSLESTVRGWAVSEDTIYVATGGILTSINGTIGVNKVSIPSHFYKVIYDPTGEKKMIAFILPNRKCSQPLSNYVVSVDEVEKRTGIDFFHQLNNRLELQLESNSDISKWKFKTYRSKATKANTKNSSTQCKAITKSTGKRCRNRTKNSNGYCRLHQP
ncbi:DNA/RNA non-specific endonuclease [Halosquirtibacter laminarini]|uniref:DNA/RNA non-specific endonuclease n=1 Tax=Halosquirtibacter laminarini TaxID=3374600 RepID=A0AC61NI87_9BACT|nr:DNA/RNA non-specific endonuclease [Prolixibacteraceae bacterium]